MVSLKIPKVLLNQLCSKTDDPNLCVNILSSDTRADNTDLQGLLNVSIILSLDDARSTNYYIHSALPNITDPELKRRLIICSSDYEQVMSGLNAVAERFTQHDYHGLYVIAEGSRKAILDCMNSLKAPPSMESSLSHKSLVVDVLIGLILAIARQLHV